MSTQLRKITARTVGIAKGAKAIGESFVVYGRAVRAVPEQGDYGDFMKIKGQFQAVNEQTGEVYNAPVFITPGGILEYELATSLQAEDENGAKANSIDFGIRFKMRESDNATGCEWVGEMLTTPSADDPVQRLANSLASKIPALSKPDAHDDTSQANSKKAAS